MHITPDTYHTPESNRAYMSNHQMKSWLSCAAREKAIQDGRYAPPDKEVFLLGQYVDRALTQPESFDEWIKEHRLDFRKDPTAADLNKVGCKTTKEEFLDANPHLRGTGEEYGFVATAKAMIARARRDEMFMNSLDGEHQVVITFDLFGVPFKAMLDAARPDIKAFTDLKTCGSLDQWQYDEELKIRTPFYESFGYWTQFSIYREAYRAKYGEWPDFAFMAAVTKQKEAGADEPSPDLGLYLFDDRERFEVELAQIEERLPRVMKWKNGEEESPRCEKCEFCRMTKVLTAVIPAENYRRRSSGV